MTSPTSRLSHGSVFLYLCGKMHQHSHVFTEKNRGPCFSAPAPEHILLSPRAAILGTTSESAETALAAPAKETHRTGPDGPINAFGKKKKKSLHKTHVSLAGIKSWDESHIQDVWPKTDTATANSPGGFANSSRNSSASWPALGAEGRCASVLHWTPRTWWLLARSRYSVRICGMNEWVNQGAGRRSTHSPLPAVLILAAATIAAWASVLMFLVLLFLLLLFLLLLFFQTHLQLENAQNITVQDYWDPCQSLWGDRVMVNYLPPGLRVYRGPGHDQTSPVDKSGGSGPWLCTNTPRLLNRLSGGWGWESVFWNSPQNHCLGIPICQKTATLLTVIRDHKINL